MIYLLHFEPPYKHARHYIGFTEDEDLDSRLNRHMKGQGSRLVKVAIAAGCDVLLARFWPAGTRTEERKLKNQKNAPRLCPKCNRKAVNA